MTVGKMITRGLFYSATLKCYVCLKHLFNFWLADGTFNVTPKMFYQFYSIHVSISGIAPACIYAFLPNKAEKTYHRFLEALKILATDKRPEKLYWILSRPLFKRFRKNFPNPSCRDVSSIFHKIL